MKLKGARAVALAATIGNGLQGWDSAAIAGALLYIKPEFNLQDNPTLEGIIVASTLIGAVTSTTCAGPAADWLGRRSMLSVSAFFFSLGALVMAWSPDVYVLIVARVLIGCSIGLAATISPILIAESAPPEIRGQLSTLPQLMGSGGLFVAYAMVFAVSLTDDPNWRLMLGIILLPSLVFLLFALFYLPESPRWLVSKGRILEAKLVLQDLRGREDVDAELALLVEGLGVGVDSCLEEWLLQPADHEIALVSTDIIMATALGDDRHGLLPDDVQGIAWIAQPITEEGGHPLLSRKASMEPGHLIDPMVTVLGSLQSTHHHILHDHHHDVPADVHRSVTNKLDEAWPEDSEDPEQHRNADGYYSDDNPAGEMDENLKTPLLLSRPNSSGKLPVPDALSRKSSAAGFFSPMSRKDSRANVTGFAPGSIPESFSSSTTSAGNIGGGWQLAWRWTSADSKAGPAHAHGESHEVGSFQRVFLLQEPMAPSHYSSTMSLPGIGEVEAVQAAALVGAPAQYDHLQIVSQKDMYGPAMVHPLETATAGPSWKDLLVPGVHRALVVGIGLQILQQFSGISAVLYFTPQILQASGAEVLLARMGVNSDSASILASGVTCLLMLPCIVVAMRLMDRSGRRQLLLATLPLLALALVGVVLSNTLLSTGLVQAAVSFAGVAIFVCAFVMGFGPIPNILCSEIFPTRVRGLCIGLCSSAMWVCNIIVTYSFPVLNRELGLEGVFGIFALITVLSWVFVFLKVPETKGMPLEVISEFFAMSAMDNRKHPQHNYAALGDNTDTQSISSKV